jgi:ABC-type glycerol-3-phosphate transport system substrate-binding protein
MEWRRARWRPQRGNDGWTTHSPRHAAFGGASSYAKPRGALGVLAAMPLLAACGAPLQLVRPEPTAGAGDKLTLPTYVPIELVTPDLPGTAAGVDSAYLTFPKTLVKSVNESPSRGGDVNVFTRVILAAPPAVDANQAWQAVNKAIGANMKLNMAPTAEYNTKLATTVAGGDIPDMVFLSTLQIVGIPQFLQKACADLTHQPNDPEFVETQRPGVRESGARGRGNDHSGDHSRPEPGAHLDDQSVSPEAACCSRTSPTG